jgi:tetratricopeptide (TPR) repeat protein
MPKIKLNLLFNIRPLVIHSARCSGKISGPNIKPRANFLLVLNILTASMVISACNTLSVNTDTENLGYMDDVAVTEHSDGVSKQADSDKLEVHETEAAPAKKQEKLDSDSLYNLLAAEFAGNSGDIEASLKHYRLAAESIEDSRIAARTAYIALYGERYDEALVALDRWHELEPSAEDMPVMYATVYLKLGQPEKAVPYIEELLSVTDGTSVDQAMVVKQLLAKDASTSDAYVVLQKLNAGEDKNKHILILQSRYAAELKKYDESMAILDQVLEIDPSLHEVVIIKARILFALGKHEEASALIRQVVEEFPDNNELRLQYARMLVEQQSLKAATEQYSILHENLPEDGEIALSLALLNIEINNLDEAVAALEHLIEIDKKVSIANYYLARIAQNRGNDKQAVAYYLRVKTGDYVFDAQLRIGVLLSVLGKSEEGLAKLEALAESQVNWNLRVKAYLAQGEVLRKEQRYKEGVVMYSRALQQNSEDVNLLYARGLMAEKVDRLDLAEADLLKVISKEPDNADALNALGYTLADRTTRYNEALVYINRAAELQPDEPAILDSLGWVSYRQGRMDDAIKWLSRAFEKLEDAEIAAHYGEVLWHADQKDKAREVWRKGKANNAKNPVLIETLERIKP